MKRLMFIVFMAALLVPLSSRSAFGAIPPADPATCAISCSVVEIMEWAGDFSAITLVDITSLTDQPTGSAARNLITNGNCSIAADNTATAQLSAAAATLTTDYGLAFDGDGITDTGGTTVSYTDYSTFLTVVGEGDVTHVSPNGVVQVTLSVRASVSGSSAPDQASYSATQTLTATWG